MPFESDFNPVLRFAVCSDVHIKPTHTVERDRMRQLIKESYALCEKDKYPHLDALYVVGDFANHGEPEEFSAFKQITDEELKQGTILNASIASHEFGFEGEEAAKNRLKELFGLEPSTHKVINGFHFISIGCTRGCHFDEAEREFAKKALEEAVADDPKKPIFFFQHPHIYDTVYGSIGWGEDELTDILVNYPQVIDFSGHSHAPINDPRSIHQKHFTSLGTGTLSYFELDEFDKASGTVPSDANIAAQFLFVEADEKGRVRVYPYDLISSEFFPFVWKIDEPYNVDSFLYTDARYKTTDAPWFENDAKAKITVEGNTVVVEFPQAKVKEEYVDGYQVILKDRQGLIKKKINMFSSYYLYDMPKTLSAKFEGVLSGEYYAEIIAESFWKTQSEKNIKTDLFTVK